MTDRAVSTTLSYVLSLSIATLLVGGLLIAGGDFVTNQREVVIEEEMNVIGHQIAANVEQADRLVEAGAGSTTVQVNQTFPAKVAGSGYDVQLDADKSQLVLTSVDPEVTVRVDLVASTELADSTADGGTITVRYVDKDGDGVRDHLVIDDA